MAMQPRPPHIPVETAEPMESGRPAGRGISGLLGARSSVWLLSPRWTGTWVSRGHEAEPLRLARRSMGRDTHSQPLWSPGKSDSWLAMPSPQRSSSLLFLECQQCAGCHASLFIPSVLLNPRAAL